MTVVWIAWHRGEDFGHDVAPGPSYLAGLYATRDEALKHCWPKGDPRFVEEYTVGLTDCA